MMSSPVVGTMPPPPAIPATLQSSTPPSVSNLMPSTVMPTPPPSSEVASNASSGGMGSPSPKQMMPASIPDVPLFGTGPTSGVDAQIEPTFISPEAVQPLFNMNAMQAPLPPANMPIPDPAILAGMPIPPTAASSQIPVNFGNQQQNPIPTLSDLQIGQQPQAATSLQHQQATEATSA